MGILDQVEVWRLAAADWLDAQEAADVLRECKNDAFAEITADQDGSSNAEKERNARLSIRWKEYRDDMLKAEADARRKRLRVNYQKMKFEGMRSENANARTERTA